VYPERFPSSPYINKAVYSAVVQWCGLLTGVSYTKIVCNVNNFGKKNNMLNTKMFIILPPRHKNR
jgi:hypothetical protein